MLEFVNLLNDWIPGKSTQFTKPYFHLKTTFNNANVPAEEVSN